MPPALPVRLLRVLQASKSGEGSCSKTRWAGESFEVQLAASLGPDAIGSCFAAVLIETSGREHAVAGGATAKIGIRYAHLVTVDVSGRTELAAEVTELAVSRPDGTGSLGISATIRNRGNSGIRPEGTFAIMDQNGQLVAKIPLTVTFAQPGGAILMQEEWDGQLDPGAYRLVGTIDVGGDVVLTPEIGLAVEDRIEVAAFEAELVDGAHQAAVRLTNLGNLSHVLSGEVAIRDSAGSQVARLPVRPVIALPGQELEATVVLPELPPGPYDLELTLTDDRVTLTAEAATQLR
jgi:hypothetical protein